MEFLPAGSLAQRLNDLVNEPRETARLVAAVARAVAHAHAQGVFHRDVKTTNILLRARDSANTENHASVARTPALPPRLSDLEACLSDFGLAKQTRDDAGLLLEHFAPHLARSCRGPARPRKTLARQRRGAHGSIARFPKPCRANGGSAQTVSSAQERERQHYVAESTRLTRAAHALPDGK
jgi:serine/threonine protein kinase